MTTSQRSEKELGELLARHGVKATRQRLAILRELAAEPNDATAQTLWTRLRESSRPAVGLATIYRTLSLLTEKGVVDTLPHREGELGYRLCGEAHHHHLVCSKCHRVVEVDERGLAEWLDRVFTRYDFVAVDHTVELTGLCSACRR
jgi:Fur family ferric uptake transcriptional regulator